MQPQDMIDKLRTLQEAANIVTISSAAVSHAIGNYIEFLGSDEDFQKLPKYAQQLYACLSTNGNALANYCEAASKLSGGENLG